MNPRLRFPCLLAAALGLCTAGAQTPDPNSRGASASSRADKAVTTGTKSAVHYPPQFDLSELPAYVPKARVSGPVRIWGSNYVTDCRVGEFWAADFRTFQPDARLEYNTPSALLCFPGLVTGQADVGVDRTITFDETLLFDRVFGYDPLEIVFTTGSVDVNSYAAALCFFVHKDNPFARITMKQVDRIFGAARTGSYVGTVWHPELARGPEENIRRWGQLGLTGEWADKPIVPYGRSLKLHQQIRIEKLAFHGSGMWNESLHECYREMVEELAKDRYGIAYAEAMEHNPQTRMLPLAWDERGPFLLPTLQTCHDRTYPLHGEVYFYLNRKPGHPLDPKVSEFVRYVLSREGQDAIQRDGKWLPLTRKFADEERRKLE